MIRKRGDQQEYGRDDARHCLQLVQFTVEEGVRCLVFTRIGAGAAIRLQQLVQSTDGLCGPASRQQGKRHGVKRTIKIGHAREGLFAHPDDPEATIIRHEVPGAERIDELR